MLIVTNFNTASKLKEYVCVQVILNYYLVSENNNTGSQYKMHVSKRD